MNRVQIPEPLHDTTKEDPALQCMRLSPFVNTCLIENLAKKGA
jgi:hypothetical protein